MPKQGSDPPGLDLTRLATWFAATGPDAARGRLSAQLIAGGKSNLTFQVGDGTTSWIVRRPPLGHVLATAHDMRREYRVITALRDTGVPVPVTYAFCDDGGVLGVPFFVMQFVDGTPYRLSDQLAPLGAARTRAIAVAMVDTLAVLHDVDPDAVGLADFGRPEGFLHRQVRRWKQQLDASHCRELPSADELHSRLAEDVPAQSPTGLVHGDFRLDNLLVDSADRVAAVVDWEMATLGDPLTDVALLVIYRRLGGLGTGSFVTDASSAPGFLTEVEILERYAAQSPRSLSRFGFYLGLAAFKLAVVLEGIHYRHLHGQTVGPGFESAGALVEPLLEMGLAALKEEG